MKTAKNITTVLVFSFQEYRKKFEIKSCMDNLESNRRMMKRFQQLWLEAERRERNKKIVRNLKDSRNGL